MLRAINEQRHESEAETDQPRKSFAAVGMTFQVPADVTGFTQLLPQSYLLAWFVPKSCRKVMLSSSLHTTNSEMILGRLA